MTDTQKNDRTRTSRSSARLVLSAIQGAGEASRAQVAAATGIHVMTVGRIVETLMSRGVLRERETEGGSQVGRPPRLLSLVEERLLCVSMFLEPTGLHLGLVGPSGHIHAYAGVPMPEASAPPERAVRWMADCLSQFLEEHRKLAPCGTVGVVVPGILDIEQGELVFSSNLHWRNVPLLEQLREYLPGWDFVLENDVKAAAVAEYRFTDLRSCRSLVTLSIGDGIGAAVILNGEIYRGQNNLAGEIGHIILNPAGKICECGKTGCLQTYVSTRALLAEAQTVYPDVTIPKLFALFREGEPFASALVNQVTEYISIAINLLANTYAPEVIVLCGSMMRQGTGLAELAAEVCQEKLNHYARNTFQLRVEQFGESGHLIGGGALALQRVLDGVCA